MNQATFSTQVLTPQGIIFEGECLGVVAPASEGEVTILPRHENFFTSLQEGLLVIKTTQKSEEYFAIESGYLQTNGKSITILISAALGASEINESLSQDAIAKAKEEIKNAPSEAQRTQALQLLRRSTLNLRVLQKYRHKKSIN